MVSYQWKSARLNLTGGWVVKDEGISLLFWVSSILFEEADLYARSIAMSMHEIKQRCHHHAPQTQARLSSSYASTIPTCSSSTIRRPRLVYWSALDTV
jgi:hypothetical protein